MPGNLVHRDGDATPVPQDGAIGRIRRSLPPLATFPARHGITTDLLFLSHQKNNAFFTEVTQDNLFQSPADPGSNC